MRPSTPASVVICLVLACSACGSHARSAAETSIQDVSPLAGRVVDAPDRTDADRKLDPGRRPAELLTFLGVSPGMRVGEVIAGAGYSTELLARAVAPGGVVYAENPGFVLRDLGSRWDERLARPAMKDVVRVDREVLDPFPPDARDLDLVLINLVYHDTVWLGIDRDKMNRAVFAALKKGGRYAVIDHSARHGSGLADVKALHRIDEANVRAEVTAAGFELQTADSFLRNPADTRDWSASPEEAGLRRGTSDRFALLFVKP
ncbi:MAG TPA: SAM-dependent methyltransferase [Polyangiaceae bacterium]|nr:SAM-dependent methyltransferase [Polyangiaceae bacterium]